MPELPEVEVLCRHLAPRARGRKIIDVRVFKPRVIKPLSARTFRAALRGARILTVTRRAKYLCFSLRRKERTFPLLGHLGMTGRMYFLPVGAVLPRHGAVVLRLPQEWLVFEDARQFGRMKLDDTPLAALGPEPFAAAFTVASLRSRLGDSRQPIKVRLLHQTVVAGLGNIYSSEVLFRARIDPRRKTNALANGEIARLHRAIRRVLSEAIARGSTMPLDFSGQAGRDGLFYFRARADSGGNYEERLQVYDREGQPCTRCRQPIRRVIQAARSTFFCAGCQH